MVSLKNEQFNNEQRQDYCQFSKPKENHSFYRIQGKSLNNHCLS